MSDFFENKDFQKGVFISHQMYYHIIRSTRYSAYEIKDYYS